MATHISPLSLARDQIAVIGVHLPGVCDGNPDSIHEARVATRRLREVLPLIGGVNAETPMNAEVKKAGRVLGRIRDLDVDTELLMRIEQRLPAAAVVTAVARTAILPRRLRRLRTAIKTLEQLDLTQLAGSTPQLPPSWRERLRFSGSWEGRLKRRTAERAQRVRDAVAHATGVYFPNRAHGTRIAIKKLRYCVEIAAATGMWNPPRLLKDMKKIQAVLGELHDAEMLSVSLDRYAGDADVSQRDISLVRQVLAADIAARHGEYVAARERLLAVCGACERFAVEHSGHGRTFLAAGSVLAASVAVPALAFKGQR